MFGPVRLVGFAVSLALGAASIAETAKAQSFTPSEQLCEVGAYRSRTGEIAVITKREKGWRYQFIDGRYGYVADANPLVYCGRKAVHVKRPGGTVETWTQAPLRFTQTRFMSDGNSLSGLLIEPDLTGEKRPLVVLVHGSFNNGWIDGYTHYPYFLAASGVSTFLFDKRGTGHSAGVYNQDFHALARDIVAGSAEAQRLAKGRVSRFGLYGMSQGGWVAPLAAQTVKPDFLVVGYGGVFTPLEEDGHQVFLELREKGYGADVMAKAQEVVAATHRVMASHFETGYEELARAKQRYGNEPWMKQIKGEFTGDLLSADENDLRKNGRKIHDNLSIDWTFDSRPVIRSISAPILWILAENDRESPGNLTLERLTALQQAGRPITLVTFPNTDHGMYEYTEAQDGTRTQTRVTDGYFRLVPDWINGRTASPYGNAVFTPPSPTSAR